MSHPIPDPDVEKAMEAKSDLNVFNSIVSILEGGADHVAFVRK